MFIEVAKIIRDKKRAKSHSVKSSALPSVHDIFDSKEEIKVVIETIRKDEVRSARKWHKTDDEEFAVEGEITMVYLFGNNTGGGAAEMKINESYDSFTRRLEVVKIDHNENISINSNQPVDVKEITEPLNQILDHYKADDFI